jgi:hypothetical protein
LVDAAQAVCSVCGTCRVARTTSTVTLADAWVDVSLAHLGLVDGDVIHVRAGARLLSYELAFTATD